MLLQPVVMNAFRSEPLPDSTQVQSPESRFGDAENSLTFQMIQRTQELCKVQDKRLARDLAAYEKNRSSTAGLLDLLRLQYDLDDMQTSAMMAKNIADKFGQAITSLTQRN